MSHLQRRKAPRCFCTERSRGGSAVKHHEIRMEEMAAGGGLSRRCPRKIRAERFRVTGSRSPRAAPRGAGRAVALSEARGPADCGMIGRPCGGRQSPTGLSHLQRGSNGRIAPGQHARWSDCKAKSILCSAASQQGASSVDLPEQDLASKADCIPRVRRLKSVHGAQEEVGDPAKNPPPSSKRHRRWASSRMGPLNAAELWPGSAPKQHLC